MPIIIVTVLTRNTDNSHGGYFITKKSTITPLYMRSLAHPDENQVKAHPKVMCEKKSELLVIIPINDKLMKIKTLLILIEHF